MAIGGLAALTAWSALSLTWAPLAGPAVDDVERNVLYLAALVAAATLLTMGWTEAALLAGITLTAAYGLSERLLPGLVELERSAAAGDRLAQPLTYWNGQGALAAIGLVLAAGLIARRTTRARDGAGRAPSPPAAARRPRRPRRPRRLAARRASPPAAASPPAVRALAGAALPILGLDLYLTLSRGALGALVAGLLVLVALVPTRAGLLAAAARRGRHRRAGDPRRDRARRRHARRRRVRCGRGDARRRRRSPRPPAPSPRPGSTARPRSRGCARSPWPRSSRRSRSRSSPSARARRRPAPSGSSPPRRNRYDYWRVAAGTFADHPLKGIGTGSFRVEWLLQRDRDESVRDAHSLYLETAAELGIVGLAALAALFGGVIAAARRARLPAASAALAAYAVHAGIDWDWELPGLTLFAVLLAGRLLAASEPAATAASPPAAADVPTSTSSPPTPAP